MGGGGPGLEDARRQGVLCAVAVLEQREEGVDLRLLGLRAQARRRLSGYACEVLGLLLRIFGLGQGLDAKLDAAVLDGAGEGQVGAQGVLGPQGEEACVLFCYLAIVSGQAGVVGMTGAQ